MVCDPSFRHVGWRRKVDEFLPLDVRALKSHGRLRPGAPFTWTWRCSGQPIGSVQMVVDARGLALEYVADGRSVSHRVEFTRTSCTLGGQRTWFTCPDCSRRCAVVYGADRRGHFSC